ncbi:MAG: hypothetical protein IJ833_01940 [Lachnospiraceae bacterium]|nr:hypothetical protein [Lachnospiraceae bacterium]
MIVSTIDTQYTVDIIVDIIGILADLLAVGIAVLSLYWSIREQKAFQRREERRRRLEQKMLWYNEVVLKDIVTQLNTCIESANQSMMSLDDLTQDREQTLKKSSDFVREEFRVLLEKFFEIRLFSKDVYLETRDYVQQIQDIYSNAINVLSGRKFYIFQERHEVQKIKFEIINVLYKLGCELTADNET